MNSDPSRPGRTLRLLGLPLLVAVAIVVIALTLGHSSPTETAATGTGGGSAMSLSVSGIGLKGCDDPLDTATCVAVNQPFDVAVNVDDFETGGYLTVQSFLTHGSLAYKGGSPEDDINPAKDCNSLKLGFIGAGSVSTSCTPGFFEGVVDKFTGAYVTHTFTCTGTDSVTKFTLEPLGGPVAGGSGSGFVLPDGITQVPMSTSLTIHCQVPLGGTWTPTVTPTPTPTPTKQPDPGDTDGDGCSDLQENGSDPTLGGLRDYLNPFDFFDVNHDRSIDVPNDILPVLLAYQQGPNDPGGPGPNYAPAKDRGPPTLGAQFPWNRTGPDGRIDVPNDLLPLIFQYLHTCGPPPPPPGMSLNVVGGNCDDPVNPTKCTVPAGSQFTLSVEVTGRPLDGYSVIQTYINHGSELTYKPTAVASDEVVWPDRRTTLLIRVLHDLIGGEKAVSHFASTNTGLVSTFLGNIVEITINCSPGASSTVVKLLPLDDPVAGFFGS